MKKLTLIALGIALIASSSSSSLELVYAQAQAVTCSSSAISVANPNGNYVYEFISTSDFAQLKVCSTTPVKRDGGREELILLLGQRFFVGDNNWRGSFQLKLDESFDDEIDIESTMQHISSPNINYTTTSTTNRSRRSLHAEGDSGTAEGFGRVFHSPCSYPNCLEDVFTEKLTWRSHSEGWFDRDEIDSWTYILEARHQRVLIIE